jgi:hypothetical protein
MEKVKTELFHCAECGLVIVRVNETEIIRACGCNVGIIANISATVRGRGTASVK